MPSTMQQPPLTEDSLHTRHCVHASQALSLILKSIGYLHFTDKDIGGSSRLSDLPKVTQVESDYNQISLTLKQHSAEGQQENPCTGVEEGLCGKMQEAKVRKADLPRAAEACCPAG